LGTQGYLKQELMRRLFAFLFLFQEPQFLSNYDPVRAGSFVWLDLPLMSRLSGVADSSASSTPLLLDALEVKAGPTGRGSPVMRRRTVGDYIVFTTTPMIHTVYIYTWFTLAAALVVLTAMRFRKKPMPIKKSELRFQK
jgi:cytochrome oxidase assembly protein ShyY1